MAAIAVIIATGIFIMGAAIGLVAVVSVGIRHEERLFREEYRYRQDQGTWPGTDTPNQFLAAGPDGPDQFLATVPPSLVCHGARALTGLWIRRETAAAPLAIPWHERRY